MIDSVSGVANVANYMSQTKANQEIDLAVAKKAQDVLKQNGENTLKLIDSTPVATGTGNANIDVFV